VRLCCHNVAVSFHHNFVTSSGCRLLWTCNFRAVCDICAHCRKFNADGGLSHSFLYGLDITRWCILIQGLTCRGRLLSNRLRNHRRWRITTLLLSHELLTQESLGRAVSHNRIVILKDRVDGKGPRVRTGNPKHILEGDRFLVGILHRPRGLLLESIDGPDSRHETISDIHNHGRCEQEGSHTQQRHDPYQLRQDRREGAILGGAKEVIPSQQQQGEYRTRPGVSQKQDEVFHIAGTNTIVHPWTMMIHTRDASITDTTMMRKRWFVRLTLTAHAQLFLR